MSPKQEMFMYAGICLLVILLSAGGLIYGVMAGLIFARDTLFTLDGILLALVCLSMGGVFSLLLLFLARKEGWIPRRGAKPAPANPAPPAEQQK